MQVRNPQANPTKKTKLVGNKIPPTPKSTPTKELTQVQRVRAKIHKQILQKKNEISKWKTGNIYPKAKWEETT